MKRKALALLLVLTILMLAVPAGVVEAKENPQKIEFNVSGSGTLPWYGGDGWYEIEFDPETGQDVATGYSAAASCEGIIKEKGGSFYLSPLNGTIVINIDGEEKEYNISVRQAKQSEPVYYQKWVVPNVYTAESFNCWVEVNIEGEKFIGTLSWTQWTMSSGVSGFTYLKFDGMVDGKRIHCSLSGEHPGIN